MIAEKETEMMRRQTTDSAGYDMYCPEDIVLKRGWFGRRWYTIDLKIRFDGSELVRTQISMWESSTPVHETLRNWVLLVFPRSSLGFKYKMVFANTVGVIDQDYRDTVKMCVSVGKTLRLHKGDRVCQGIFVPYGVLTDEIVPTKVRYGGIGSTNGH